MDDNKRTDTARRTDDSELIEGMEPAPDQGGRSGGDLQTDIGTKADLEHRVYDKPGVTRVHKENEREEANDPRKNQR